MKMRVLRYHIFWPGGNTTALVPTSVARPVQPDVARAIMAIHREVEQVGFLEPANMVGAAARVQMMGGEFCGNAARCAGLFLARMAHGDPFATVLEVSGFSGPVSVQVNGQNVSISLPGSFLCQQRVIAEGAVVDLQGIRHIVVAGSLSAGGIQTLLARYRAGFPAVGVMLVEWREGEVRVTPHVWVRATDTCVAESACGSGSIAAALVEKPVRGYAVAVRQPSGEVYQVQSHYEGDRLSSILLAGVVKYLGSDQLDVARPHSGNLLKVQAYG